MITAPFFPVLPVRALHIPPLIAPSAFYSEKEGDPFGYHSTLRHVVSAALYTSFLSIIYRLSKTTLMANPKWSNPVVLILEYPTEWRKDSSLPRPSHSTPSHNVPELEKVLQKKNRDWTDMIDHIFYQQIHLNQDSWFCQRHPWKSRHRKWSVLKGCRRIVLKQILENPLKNRKQSTKLHLSPNANYNFHIQLYIWIHMWISVSSMKMRKKIQKMNCTNEISEENAELDWLDQKPP